MIRSAGYRIKHVVTLLKLANGELPRLEQIYDKLKSDIAALEVEKQTSTNTEITGMVEE